MANLGQNCRSRTLSRSARPDKDTEIQLEALLFCPPYWKAMEVAGMEKLTEVLPSQSKKQQDHILKGIFSHYERAFTSISPAEELIAPSFRDPAYQIPFTITRLEEQTGRIEGTLQYLFSNGCILSAGELVRHRWATRVDCQLLPLRSDLSQETSSIPLWANLVNEKVQPWRAEESRKLSQIVLWTIERALKRSIPVFIVDSQNRLQKRKKAPLLGILPAGKSLGPLYFKQQTHLVFQPGPSHNQGSVALTPSLDKNIQESSIPTWELCNYQMVLRPESILNEMILQLDLDSLEGQGVIRQGLKALEHQVQTLGLPKLIIDHPALHCSSQVHFEIWINTHRAGGYSAQGKNLLEATENLQISWMIKDLGVRVWNFPFPLQRWLLILQSGIGAFTEKDPKEIAFGHSGSKRDYELKILRHTGFAAALLLEVFSFGLHHTASTGEKFEDLASFKKWLNFRLASLANRIFHGTEHQPIRSMESGVSQRVWNLLSEVIENTASLCIQPLAPDFNSGVIYLADRIIAIPDISVHFSQFLFTLLCHTSRHTQGGCFLKARMPVGFTYPSQDLSPSKLDWFAQNDSPAADKQHPDVQTYIPSPDSSLEPEAFIHTCLSLIGDHVDLYLNQKSVKTLSPQDLKTVFELCDSETQTTDPLDWFELNPRVFLMGQEIDQQAVLRLSREGTVEHQGKVFVIPTSQLPSLRRLSAFWSRLQKGKTSHHGLVLDSQPMNYQKLSRSETLEFLMLGDQLQAEFRSQNGKNSKWNEVYDFYLSLSTPRPTVPLPPSIQAELKPYQNTGFQWFYDLYRLRLGGILADDMGLGKTLQSLVFLEFLRHEGRLSSSLIIVPTSLTWNWKSEAEKFTPQLPIQIFDPKKKLEPRPSNSVLIVTYGLLVEHAEWFLGTPESPCRWNLIIFDEAQNLKNFRSKRTEISRNLCADHKFCLTGTPLENHVGELFSLLDLVVPGCLGNYSDFKALFGEVFDPVASSLELAFLKKKIKPLVLRRSKSTILSELPPKVETLHRLPLETQQKKIYRDIAMSWNKQVNESILRLGENKSQLMMLTALLRLRQACSDPACLPQVNYHKTPPKFELLGESLSEILELGESAIIFTQFLKTLERITFFLRNRGVQPLCIHGSVSRKEREIILREFQDPKTPPRVLIMTLKTGGVGLNLTRARYVFHLEPWWNPAVENQATDRTHRIGQTGSVQVYRYVMQDTVEEKIETLKQRKSTLFDAVVNEPLGTHELPEAESLAPQETKGFQNLTRKDFELLLSE